MRNLARLLVPCVVVVWVACGPGPDCGANLDYNEETGLCECMAGGTWGDDGYCRYPDGAVTLADGAVSMADASSDYDAGLPDAGPLDAGATDACVTSTFYRDADGDGHGAATDSMTACVAPDGYVESDDDCNDTCETCLPGGTETCTEPALDEDCDGTSNEGCACTNGTSMSCGTTEAGECAFGTQQCVDGAYATCEGAIEPVTEVCNGLDDDCDGTIDDGATTTFYQDADNDGYGNASVTMQACSAPTGYVASASDCDDVCLSCRPGGTEACDLDDNDCDGRVDEGVDDLFYPDCDGDGFAPQLAVGIARCSAPSTGPSICPSGSWTTTQPVGQPTTDCADREPRAFPGQTIYFDTRITGVPTTRDFDFDCDGNETGAITSTNWTTFDCNVSARCNWGWTGSTVPSCGAAAEVRRCFAVTGGGCGGSVVVAGQVQTCR